MTLQEIKDTVAKNNGYEDWYDTYSEPMGFEERENLINSVVYRACEEQRQLCAEAAKIKPIIRYSPSSVVDKESILNTPSPC